jgi:hypothetical protein
MLIVDDDEPVLEVDIRMPDMDDVAKPFEFDHLERTVTAVALYAASPDERWSRLVSDVFRVVRRMLPEGRASTGLRLEEPALAAAVQALADLQFVVGVASRLGDLAAASRSVIESAVKTAHAGLPPR